MADERMAVDAEANGTVEAGKVTDARRRDHAMAHDIADEALRAGEETK